MMVSRLRRQMWRVCLLALAMAASQAAQPRWARGCEPARQQQVRKRKAKIVKLMRIVQDSKLAKSDRPKVVQAILELGELRAVEAAPLLAEKLGFHRNASGRYKGLGGSSFPGVEYIHPAVKALRLIGKPALRPIMQAMSTRDRPWTFRFGAYCAILKITGGLQPTRSLIAKYQKKYVDKSHEYARRARRIELLMDHVPAY